MTTDTLSVLVLEDNELDAMLVSARLAGERFELAHARSLAEALERLAQAPVDCVLVDLMLPDSEGLETIDAVRAAAPAAAIVVLSGSDDERAAVQAVQLGAQDYLVKGAAGSELLRRSVRYATERKRIELRLAQLALHDALTGLPNRALLHDRLTQALARARRRGAGSVAVVFLDVDRFKLVNDTLGHDAGDRLLCDLGKRIAVAVRPSDTVARLGGDEFVVLCDDLPDPGAAEAVAGRVLEALAEPIDLDGIPYHLGVSMGIAVGGGPDGVGAETLLSNADAAMYRAKAGGGGIEFFSEELRHDAARRLRLHNELHRALDRGELVVHYQPQMGIVGSGAHGVEALVRWRHPEHGLLMPADFIPLAEETGLIVPIGEWVLREACRQLAAWRAEGVADDALVMGVNLSARQLARRDVVDVVERAIAAAEVPPGQLCLEITETTVMDDATIAAERLHALKGLGVRLAIDDFGTGYSSLTHMHRFPIDVLKIDRSFIAGCDHDDQARGIVEAVIRLARALGLTPVAEGVESERQADQLRVLGCGTAQGFLFARAEPPETVAPLLRERGPAVPAPGSAPLRAVICDDAPETRMLVRAFLEETCSVEVVAEAADGRSGLAAVAAHGPDVLVLDLGMPGLDGLEVLELVRAAAPLTRVVVLTALHEDGLAERVAALGADGFVAKARLHADLRVAVLAGGA